jgi:site-specific DNA recombinase
MTQGKDKPRAVLYSRVSVKNGNDSLEAQTAACRKLARAQRFSIVGEFQDDGLSGTLGSEEREGLSLALAMLEDREADVLVVLRGDRLARRLHVHEAILARIWRHGGRVFEADGEREVLEDDASDPMRTFTRQVLAAAAELERGMIVARMQAGRRRARERGDYIGGNPPFGFEIGKGGKLVPAASEQAELRRVHKLAARLRYPESHPRYAGKPRVREIARECGQRPEWVRRVLEREPAK